MEFETKGNEVYPVDGEAEALLRQNVIHILKTLGCSIDRYGSSFSLRFKSTEAAISAVRMLSNFRPSDDADFLFDSMRNWIADGTGVKR